MLSYRRSNAGSPSQGHLKEENPRDDGKPYALQKLLSETRLEKLESGVRVGMTVLSNIKTALDKRAQNNDVAQVIDMISTLQKPLEQPRTLVGVVGATGAGKSSVINAVLGEEMLLPTNCMRACTATATEIAYNSSDVKDERYRAEVEFISEEDWQCEVDTLVKDLSSLRGQMNWSTIGPDTEAGIALAKIRAVYPDMTKDILAKQHRSLATRPSVRKLLGSIKVIKSSTAQDFTTRLRKFVEAKEQTHGQSATPPEMEYWPLIKVVKVFVKSKILQSGLVLVDLPGVHDNNAARAAVAATYMQECTGLWVVAPITRAVNDKSAHILLDESFKRQLQMDGLYSDVTFICSKTDDISLTEVLANFRDADIQKLYAETEGMKAKLQQMKAGEEAGVASRTGRTRQAARSTKRPSINDDEVESPAKRVRYTDDTVKDKSPASGSSHELQKNEIPESGDLEKSQTADPSGPEKAEPSTETMEPAESTKNTRFTSGTGFLDIGMLAETKALELRIEANRAKLKHMCIQLRNKKTGPEIKSQFVDGLRDLDQDAANEMDADKYDPEDILRDYDEISAKLPVFCVSARAFQKLSGNLDMDEPITGFVELTDTEIPQLRKHVVSLAESARAAVCRGFLHDLDGLLISLLANVIAAGEARAQATVEQARGEAFLKNLLDEFGEAVQELADRRTRRCEEVLRAYIMDKFDAAIVTAADKARTTVESWTKPMKDGGIPYSTFRAACTRHGAFKGSKRNTNFNSDLVRLLQDHVGLGWENFQQRALPKTLSGFCSELVKLIRVFHDRMQELEVVRESKAAAALSNTQLDFLRKQMSDIGPMRRLANTFLKSSNRKFLPPVKAGMAGAYDTVLTITGPGCQKRMGEHLSTHIRDNAVQMFQLSVQEASAELKDMTDRLGVVMHYRVKEALVKLQSCYGPIVGRTNLLRFFEKGRKELRALLLDADKRFAEVLRE